MTAKQPKGFSTLSPYLVVKDGAKAIDFYKQVFGATEVMRMDVEGRVGHAQLQIGDSSFMLASECPEWGSVAPDASSSTRSTSFYLYVNDPDATFKKAIDAKAKQLYEVKDQFYGDRTGSFTDPFGHVWTVAKHVRDVSEDEMKRAMKEMQNSKTKAA